MADSSWIKFYPSEWLTGTRGMTASETGVYITLVMMMYEKAGAIDNDPRRLARSCGIAKPTFNKVLHSLVASGKVIVIDGKISRPGNLFNEKEKALRSARNRRYYEKQKAQA